MSSKAKRMLPLYIALLIYFVVVVLFSFTTYKRIFVMVLKPIFLFLVTIFVFLMTKDVRNRNRNKYSKRQNIIIIIISYCLIYYLSGLIFGFYKNSYSLTIVGILSNFLSFFIVAIFQEYIRYKMIISTKNKSNLIIITIFFILINIDFSYLFHINNIMNLTQYFFTNLLPIIIINITLTYLASNVDLIASMLYAGLISGITLFSPIIPRHEWIFTDLLYFIVLLAVISSINTMAMLDDKQNSRKDIKKDRLPWSIFVFAFVFVFFVLGIFKYQPIAIMSNSMCNYFARGDVVIIEKIKKDEITINKGDVIYYYHNSSYITHRVVDIVETDDGYVYYTKGDNNDDIDSWTVATDEIKGIVRLRIKYLGWLSVWFYELLQ